MTIGLVSSLSGIDLPLGADVRLGAQLAVDEQNAAGGVGGHQANLLVIDDRSATGQAGTAFTSLLSSHAAGALYQAFPPAEARRILRRLEFHYTPKHASWLNMVEIEIGVLRGQCLDRRIDDPNKLKREIAAWERQRNAARARINWMFTTDKARAKMGRAYPVTPKES